MAGSSDWRIPAAVQPKPADYSFDLDAALSAVVGLSVTVPGDAFTAEALGTERAGNGVLIRNDGLVLTIGYLVTEAAQIWLTFNDGRTAAGHLLGYDQESGLGLVQALARMDVPALRIGRSADVALGDRVVVAGAGGRTRAVAARVAAKQEFAGYWEYLLNEAMFTVPAHPHWGGTAVINMAGELVGIGSLQLQKSPENEKSEHLNMVVPIDLLSPVLDDLQKLGRPNRPPRPWLGLYATEMDDRLVLVGLAKGGPADLADLRAGDVVVAAGGQPVNDLAALFRRVWSFGNAGVAIPLTIMRDGRTFEISVTSGDRNSFLKTPRLH